MAWELKVDQLTKIYTGRPIIDHLSFTVEQGQKIALVAKNGGGKTTLLRLLMWELDKTDGKVEWRKGLKIWYLLQDFRGDLNHTIAEELFAISHPAASLIREYEWLVQNPDTDPERFQQLFDEIDAIQAWDYESKVNTIISRLQLTSLLQQPFSTLSGWELKRVALAKTLIDEPDFLVLDEPTNHLDLQMIEWLENYLKNQHSTLFMITHDRYFLESVCDEIYELDRWKLYFYPWNYSYFLQKQAERRENESIATEKLRQLLKRELVWMRKSPRARATKQNYRQKEFYHLESQYDEQKELLYSESGALDIPLQERRLWTKILKIKNLKKAFGQKIILDQFSYDFKFQERIWIIGKNGVGKSTFIKLLLWEEQPDSGVLQVGQTVVFWYYQQGEIEFPEWKRVIDVIRDVGEYLVLADGEKISASMLLERFLFPAQQQYQFATSLSWGEKRRLFLLKTLMANPNFLILDEPTNDLDLLTIRILEDFLLQFRGCLLIVSHDRAFMDRLVDHLFVFEGEGKVTDFRGTYTERNHLQTQQKEQKTDHSHQISVDLSSKAPESSTSVKKLSYAENIELQQLIKELEELEDEKQQISRIFDNKDLPYDEIALLSEHLWGIIKTIELKEARCFELMETQESTL